MITMLNKNNAAYLRFNLRQINTIILIYRIG